MNVRWSGALDRDLTVMFHGGASDEEIAAAVPNATVHAVELRRSFLGLHRGKGPAPRAGLWGGLADHEADLTAEAARLGVPPWALFSRRTDADDRQIAALSRAIRQKTPFLEVAGQTAAD